jgi:hypothetical protein
MENWRMMANIADAWQDLMGREEDIIASAGAVLVPQS